MAGGGDDKFAGKGGRNGDDKFAGKGAALQGGSGSAFRAGGWAVVAFIGPVGLDVGQLATSMLGLQSGGSPQGSALHDLAVEAQDKARQRAQALKIDASNSKAYLALTAKQKRLSAQPRAKRQRGQKAKANSK